MAYSIERNHKAEKMKLWRRNEVRNALKNKLEVVFASGKEPTGWFIYKGKKVTRVTVPKGRDTLKKGTQKSIRESLRLNSSNFDALLECPLRFNEYVGILKKKNYINW